jgi:anti-sigma-K factor RskA
MNRLPEPPAGMPDPDDDLLELYALDLLDDAETERVERLLESDPAARERLRELRGVTAMLAFDLEPVQASPELKERILAAARADLADAAALGSPQAPGAVAPAPIALDDARAARARSGGWSSRLAWAVAAVLAVALVGSLAWNMRLRDELADRPQTVTFAVTGSDEAVGVQGEVLVIGDDGETILKLSGLPPLERGQVYQVWLIEGDTPQPNVTFVGDNSGLASVGVVGSSTNSDLLGITIEPTGGSETPTTPVIIVSDLTTQS